MEAMESTELIVPSVTTLRKYGLDEVTWRHILQAQGGVCGVCGKFPSTGRFVTDHEHRRGWKHMPPEERLRYVRGVTCWYCNHAYLGRGITLAKAEGVVRYLSAYEARKP
jgi:hypothetical protein